ncbi:type I restriction-modification enzyme R subunit C-terminal domain-containing protein [Cohnella nanjingensis]|uniref:EcoEI R protein C-terminal domain-containing protein n=1 Tax=Cohnella nanjingensis TaxID=1387779 RepID=A0A7X0RMJ0_9BACL|nr:type I restriction-modification enzyme R subunit C-terminal domain-containing protein [Cohnella nanjingensis]MBB6670278.1 hypothetical protein [Cohnella nanjingensis]
MSKAQVPAAGEPAKFTKVQILAAKRFSPNQRDWLQALLQEGAEYTVEEAAQLLDQLFEQEAK